MSSRSRPLKSLITIKRIALVMIALTLLPLGNGQITDLLTGKSPAAAALLAGPVTHVRDGDTIEVQGVPVRIANLDCAELGTPEGEAAKVWMSDLLAGASVICNLSGRTSYDRKIGTCSFTGADLGEILIREGVCGRWID